MVGKKLQMQMHHGVGKSKESNQKEADLLSGDAIINFKTIQSFGHEDKIVQKYSDFCLPNYKIIIRGHFKSGVLFAISSFMQMIMMGVMFWVAAKIMKEAGVNKYGMPNIDPT